VNLLAFDKWTGEEPYVPISVAKWIFSGCIIASWLNLGFEHWRALRVIKRGGVAESFLDSLAVRLQSIRIGRRGRGWRRFLVFAELTKSKKGAEYVALFTYFSFQSWIRVIFCSGPRQVVNALTLYSVIRAKTDEINGDGDAGSVILQFFSKMAQIAEANKQEAVILSGMLFTLIIWVFAVLSLILALLFYLLFLWHYIPNGDGGLSGYCERKVNERLTKIVSVKVNKALQEEERKKIKAERKAIKNGEKPATVGRQATIPTLFDAKDGDKLPEMPMLYRNDTSATLPLYSSRPGTPSSQQPSLPPLELSNLDQKRPFPARSGTSSSAISTTSFAPNASLMGGASEMGYGGRSASPAPSLPSIDTGNLSYPQRTVTSNSNNSQWSRGTPGPSPMGPTRNPTQDNYRGPMRTMTPDTYSAASSLTYSDNTFTRSASPGPRGPPLDSYGRPVPRAVGGLNGQYSGGSEVGRSSPAPSQMGRNSPAPRGPMNNGPPSPTGSNASYQAFNPNNRSASASIPQQSQQYPTPGQQRPYRNMTEPVPQRQQTTTDYFGDVAMPPRVGTAQSMRSDQPQRPYHAPTFSGSDAGSQYGPRSGSPASFNARPTGPGPQQGSYRG